MTLPLKEVQRIDRASHGTRRGALTGAVGGFGLGMALSCVSSESHCIRDCHALPYGRTFTSHFVETTPHAQIGGSIDKAITPRLTGFGTTRFVLGKERGLAVTGGVRVRFGSRAVMVF